MKVTLLRATPDALDLLLTTKNRRLANDDDPANWSLAKKMSELAYMRDTIKSSWAFIDYVFEIEDVSRIFTHQFVRSEGEHLHMGGDFAQESQRTIELDDLSPSIDVQMSAEQHVIWQNAVGSAKTYYEGLIASGMPTQEARKITPEGKLTSIIAKFDLKQLHFMGLTRLCVRTQGEYQDVFRAMRQEILNVHPWAEDFIDVACAATGTCAFPRYGQKECPIYDPRMDLVQLKADTKKKFWSAPKHVAVPVAKDGRTM